MYVIVHIKSPAKLHYFIKLCKRLRFFFCFFYFFYMFYSIILRVCLACLKKNSNFVGYFVCSMI